MERRKLHPEGPSCSRLITGVWRWEDLSDAEATKMIQTSLDLGMTTFDHADIYGDHTIEEKFGNVLGQHPGLRQKMELITKCGIKFPSDRRPKNKSHIYDTTREHIIWSAENSLRLLHTDYLDLLLIHRPDPLSDPEEVAAAFTQLYEQGKVRHFGVSNYSASQFRLLQKYFSLPLVTNQIELSITCVDPFFNGDVDVLMEYKSAPMAWSPLAGGKLMEQQEKFSVIAHDLNCTVSQLAISWLLTHPSGVFPVIGTTKIERLKELAKAIQMAPLDKDSWFAVLKNSRGYDIP